MRTQSSIEPELVERYAAAEDADPGKDDASSMIRSRFLLGFQPKERRDLGRYGPMRAPDYLDFCKPWAEGYSDILSTNGRVRGMDKMGPNIPTHILFC